MKIVTFLSYISALSTILLPTAFGIIKYGSLRKNSVFRFFFFYFILSAAIELICSVLALKGINNMVIGNLFFLAQCVILSLLLVRWIESDKLQKLLIVLLSAVVLFGLFRFFVVNPYKNFDDISIALENIVLVTASGIALFYIGSDIEILLLKNPKFWFATAVFVYFSVSIVIFCTANFLIDDMVPVRKYTWIINSVLTILTNIFYVTGLLCLPKKRI